MLHAEYTKMKRSSIWMTVVLLPVLAVVTGSINYVNNPGTLGRNWASFSSQVTLFYGLIFYSVGVSLIVSSLWRMEHRGNNWNSLLSNTERLGSLLLTKMFVAFILTLGMQIVLIVISLVSGLLIVDVPEGSPANLILVSMLAVIGAIPLIALQTLLSVFLRSFAAPVVVCILGCVAGIASVTSVTLRPLSYILPQGLITQTMSLGSTALTGSGGLNILDALALALCSAITFGIIYFINVLAIKKLRLR